MEDHALTPNHTKIDLKIDQNRLKTTSNNQSNNSLKNNTFQSRNYSQNGAQNEPQIHQNRPPASIGPAKSTPMIKNTLPTPPKPRFSFIFDLFWTSFGHVFDLKSIYVQTRIESNDPMFKSHNEEKVTTRCSNNEESTYVFLRTPRNTRKNTYRK